ncbi:MAG TPA: hypothetical protein VIW67_14470 [Terriglobales bacterium]|jgi:hypothetical protein
MHHRSWNEGQRHEAALQAISDALSHLGRQEKDIFDVTGQRCNALNYYEKWHEFPARSADFARAINGAGPAERQAIHTRLA